MTLVVDREVRQWAYAVPWFGMGIEYLDTESIDVRRQFTNPRGYVYRGSLMYTGHRIQKWLNPPGTLTRNQLYFRTFKDVTIGRGTNSIVDVMGRQNLARMGTYFSRTVSLVGISYMLWDVTQEWLSMIGEAFSSYGSNVFSAYQSGRR